MANERGNGLSDVAPGLAAGDASAPARDGTPVTVVVVARNEEKNIDACMRSLVGQILHDVTMSVLLVDDGSTDRTVEYARRAMPAVRVVSNACRSISANRNLGLHTAATELVAFLDADCEASPRWIQTLVEAFRQESSASNREHIAAVGGPNIPPRGSSRHYDALGIVLDSYLGSRGSVQGTVLAQYGDVDHLPGLNVMFRKSLVERVGGWDERFARIGEDEDLSRRLRDRGYRLRYTPHALVTHRQRSSLWAWGRNMFTYGKGRTWLMRRHPNAFEPLLLGPPLLPALLPLYLPILLLTSTLRSFRSRRPELTFDVFGLYAVTHLCYGAGQVAGLFNRGDSKAARARRPKLGLIVLKNAGNLGDSAIFLSTCQRLRLLRAHSAMDLFVVGLGPSGVDVRPIPADADGAEQVIAQVVGSSSDSRRIQGLGQAATHGLRLLWTLCCLDGLVVCGGQWLHDLKLPYHGFVCLTFALARMARCRVGVFSVGMGPLRRRAARLATRLALGRDALVVVRDRRSLDLCREIGLQQAVLGMDPALELPSRPSMLELAGKGPILGFCPCAWFRFENLYDQPGDTRESMEREIVSLLAAFVERGWRVLLLPTMNPEDKGLCQRLLGRWPSGLGVPVLIDTERLGPQELQGIIGRLDFLVSMRLHPIIFAANTETRCAAINYAVKVEEFCRDLGLEEGLIPLDGPGWSEAVLELALAQQPPGPGSGKRDHALQRLGAGYEALFQWLSGHLGTTLAAPPSRAFDQTTDEAQA